MMRSLFARTLANNSFRQAEAPEGVGELVVAEHDDDEVLTEVSVEERHDLEALIQLAQRRLAGSNAKAKAKAKE